MKNNRLFPIIALFTIASLSIAACSPKAAPEPSAPTTVEEIAVEPTQQVAENLFNPAALGSCYNPFNPVMEGKIWKYNMVSGDTTSTMDISYKDVTSSSFTSIQQFPDISTEVQWTCSPDGLLSSQFANMSIAQVPDLKFETVEVNGVLVPTADKWQVGYSWNTEYVIKVSFTSGETAFEGQGNMTVLNRISANETVTVPAGTYNDAFKVDITGNMVMNIMGTESTLPLTYSTWYVKDVGMVKSASADPTLTYTIELASLN